MDWLVPFYLALIIYVLFTIIRNKNKIQDQFVVYSLISGIGTIVFLFFLGLIKPLFLDRYVLFTLPFVYIFLATTLCKLRGLGLVALSIVFVVGLSKISFVKDCGMDYRNITSLVKKLKKADDLVIINTKDNLHLFCYYFDKELYLSNKKTDSLFNNISIIGVEDTIHLMKYKDMNKSRVILVQSYHTINNRKDLVGRFLDQHEKVLYNDNSNKGIELSIYKINKRY